MTGFELVAACVKKIGGVYFTAENAELATARAGQAAKKRRAPRQQYIIDCYFLIDEYYGRGNIASHKL